MGEGGGVGGACLIERSWRISGRVGEVGDGCGEGVIATACLMC